MCYSLYRCTSAHYRIKLDWLICRSCTFCSSELAELCCSVPRQEYDSASPAWHTEVSVLTPHCPAQATKDPGHHSSGHFPHSHSLNPQVSLSPALREMMCDTQRDPDAGHLPEVVMLRGKQLTQTVTARLNRLSVPCFPWYPHPSFQPPFLRQSATHLSCKTPPAPASFKYFSLSEWICCLELPLSPLTPIVISIKRLEA